MYPAHLLNNPFYCYLVFIYFGTQSFSLSRLSSLVSMVTTLLKLISVKFIPDWKYCPSLCDTKHARVPCASRYCDVTTLWEQCVIIYLQFIIFGVQFLILGAHCNPCCILLWEEISLREVEREIWKPSVLWQLLNTTSVSVERLIIQVFIVIIFLFWRIDAVCDYF